MWIPAYVCLAECEVKMLQSWGRKETSSSHACCTEMNQQERKAVGLVFHSSLTLPPPSIEGSSEKKKNHSGI